MRTVYIFMSHGIVLYCTLRKNENNKNTVLKMSLISLSKFNLPLIGTFTRPTPPGPYRATTCRGRELNYGSHTYFFFWPHKDMEGLLGWVISQMPGPPPRQHKHERQYTPSTQSVIPTRRIWDDDYDGQMILMDLGGIKFPDMCLTGEEKPRKTSPRKLVPNGDRTRADCIPGVHATAFSPVVDRLYLQLKKIIELLFP